MFFYVTLGLPGCGKTTYINENLGHCTLVSADEIKKEILQKSLAPDSEAHELSVKMAEEKLYEIAGLKSFNLCMDGGGVNNNYTERIIRRMVNEFGYVVVLIYFDTPTSVCLERNAARNRRLPVPEIEIIKKSVRINECLIRYSELADKVITVPYYTNRHIFMDMDGTMAAYQHIPFDQYGCIDFVAGRYFVNAQPVSPVIDNVNRLEKNGATVYVFSASPDNLCMQEKNDWLDVHVPAIQQSNRYFIGNKRYKFVMLRNICAKLKLDYKDVTFVDDDHQVITDCHKIGINGIHPSMFLTANFGF